MKRAAQSAALAGLFAALADPTRLRLLNLMEGHEVCVCHFVEILRMTQPKVSRHLAYLRRAGVVEARREGKWMHYRIAPSADTAQAAILAAVLASFAGDKAMQADRVRLERASCAAPSLVMPQPVAVSR